MKQFLTINDNGDMLNIDMIAAITPTRNGCTILTKDGREFHSVFNLAKELEDDAEIRAVVPCHGVAALYYLGDNQTEIRPCPLVYLLSDGSLEPVEFAEVFRTLDFDAYVAELTGRCIQSHDFLRGFIDGHTEFAVFLAEISD